MKDCGSVEKFNNSLLRIFKIRIAMEKPIDITADFHIFMPAGFSLQPMETDKDKDLNQSLRCFNLGWNTIQWEGKS